MQPDGEDGEKIDGRDVANDQIKDARNGKKAAAFEFFASAFHAEDPAVK